MIDRMDFINDHYYFCKVKDEIEVRKLVGNSFNEVFYLDNNVGHRVELYKKDILGHIGRNEDNIEKDFPEYFI